MIEPVDLELDEVIEWCCLVAKCHLDSKNAVVAVDLQGLTMLMKC